MFKPPTVVVVPDEKSLAPGQEVLASEFKPDWPSGDSDPPTLKQYLAALLALDVPDDVPVYATDGGEIYPAGKPYYRVTCLDEPYIVLP